MEKFTIDKIKNAVDDAKNAVKAKIGTETERKIEEALNNKNWGASSTLLNDLAQLTREYEEYNLIMKKIWESLSLESRQWRTVFKALTLLDHLIKNGTDRVVENARDHLFKIRQLTDFSYFDGSADKGAGVREKAKQVMELLNDNDRIREEREKSRRLRDKYVGIGSGRGSSSIGYGGDSYSSQRYNSSYSYDGGPSSQYGKPSSPSGYSSSDTYGAPTSNASEIQYDYGMKPSKEGTDISSNTEFMSPKEVSSSIYRTANQTAAEENKAAIKTTHSTAPSSTPSLIDQDFFATSFPASSSSSGIQPLNNSTNFFDTFNTSSLATNVANVTPQQTLNRAEPNNLYNIQQTTSMPYGTGKLAGMQPQQGYASSNMIPYNVPTAASSNFGVGFEPPRQSPSSFPAPVSISSNPGYIGYTSQQQQQVRDTTPSLGKQMDFSTPGSVTSQTQSSDAWGSGANLFNLNNIQPNTQANRTSQDNAQMSSMTQKTTSMGSNINSFSGLDTLAGLQKQNSSSYVTRTNNPPNSASGYTMGFANPEVIGQTNMNPNINPNINPNMMMNTPASYGGMQPRPNLNPYNFPTQNTGMQQQVFSSVPLNSGNAYPTNYGNTGSGRYGYNT